MPEDIVRPMSAPNSSVGPTASRQIFTSREQGSRERTLAQKAIAKGNSDWLACKLRDPTKRPEDLLVCRETQGCLIDARFGFLDQ